MAFLSLCSSTTNVWLFVLMDTRQLLNQVPSRRKGIEQRWKGHPAALAPLKMFSQESRSMASAYISLARTEATIDHSLEGD